MRLSLPLFFFLSFVGITAPASAVEPVNETFFGSLAIHGYDPVAYFIEKKPVKGEKSFSYEWEGAKWLFASNENLKAFEKAPEKYAPQFGGYCAWAVAHGSTADIDPEVWSVVDGKLYLNYSKDIQKKWNADRAALIKKGNEEWPKIVDGGDQ
ncbi:YHS domain-containing (seleno)protein [Puniceicoccus vermicola]|uniref:YHS domain-containing protein n=1 Tax=Puniceicoccus vermicola TaxID=388746 RepID=A0A7X1E3W7_9BACT|nr:YHS domain-containing (seleno)protein [Puniceicoccus vermicola]MBC2601506.1 YHS domain-containing protein [Puniceicoccus vermicola]